MKASDLIQLLEYGKAFTPKARTMRRDRRPEKETDPLETMMRMKRMVDEFNKFSADLEKINKKEEKKDDKKKSWWEELSGMQKFTIVLAVTPFLSILELLPIVYILKVSGVVH